MKLPLFKQYPLLEKKLSYVALGNFPTPIIKLSKLSDKLSVDGLYLKNDGVSGVPIGGNKVRKLEFLFGDALARRAKMVITVGRAGSNHALTTVAWAKKFGLEAHSFLSPQLNAAYLQRNLLLTLYYGGKIHYFDTNEKRNKAAQEFCKENRAYLVPLGGSCSLGVIGFVNAAFELKEQIEAGLLPEPDYIYVAAGSAGTATGLIIGLKLAGLKTKVVPVRVCDDLETTIEEFIDLLNETSSYLCSLDFACQRFVFSNLCVGIQDQFAGEQYAQITPQAAEAIKLLNDTEGIKLDGTYAGKAFAALLNDIQEEQRCCLPSRCNLATTKNKVILFWNTFCSGKFSELTVQKKKSFDVDYKQLPKELHWYFKDVGQALDQGV